MKLKEFLQNAKKASKAKVPNEQQSELKVII
jgi:hypothetical protein